ncbi:MAG: methyltransferase domain-containing protein [Halobacteriales archaeon]
MTVSNDWNRTIYRLYAPMYDWLATPFEHGRQRAIDRLDVTAGDRVLLVGCGTGRDLDALPAGASVVGVDITPAMVRRTAARADAVAPSVEAQVADGGALPFEADAFDAVTLHLVLSVVPDPAAVVAETARVLAPGGRASIYDKFVPADESPSRLRRAVNPLARRLFADLTRPLEPLVAETDLELGHREPSLGGLYTVTVARNAQPAG